MKYISLIDQLGINIEEISKIDAAGIIRLKKQLKAKAMLGDASNLGDVSALIDQLEDETTRRNHVFVEKHNWLKLLITGRGMAIRDREVKVSKEIIDDLESLKRFLAPFIEDSLKSFLPDISKSGKYSLLLKVLDNNFLFTEESHQIIVKFLKTRINFTTAYIKAGRISENTSTIHYISNHVFIKCLNEYPDRFNNEIREINSLVIARYNKSRNHTSTYSFRFSARVMYVLGFLNTSDFFLEKALTSNAQIAKQYVLHSDKNELIESEEKSRSGCGIFAILVGIIFVVRILIGIGDFASESSRSSRNNQSDFDREYNKRLSEIRKNLSDNDISKIIKINSLSDKIMDSIPGVPHVHELYENPFPAKFSPLHKWDSKKSHAKIIQTTILNLSNKELILFVLRRSHTMAIYVPTDSNATVPLLLSDKLVFYTGNNFTTFDTDKSYFYNDAHMSEVYFLTDAVKDTLHQIEVFEERMKETDLYKNPKREPYLLIDSIFFQHISIKEVPLESNLFRRY